MALPENPSSVPNGSSLAQSEMTRSLRLHQPASPDPASALCLVGPSALATRTGFGLGGSAGQEAQLSSPRCLVQTEAMLRNWIISPEPGVQNNNSFVGLSLNL